MRRVELMRCVMASARCRSSLFDAAFCHGPAWFVLTCVLFDCLRICFFVGLWLLPFGRRKPLCCDCTALLFFKIPFSQNPALMGKKATGTTKLKKNPQKPPSRIFCFGLYNVCVSLYYVSPVKAQASHTFGQATPISNNG